MELSVLCADSFVPPLSIDGYKILVNYDTHVQSYPGSVLSQVTSFVLYAVWVLYSLQKFHTLIMSCHFCENSQTLRAIITH